jgi:3'-5' exoribonuclease
MKNIFVKDFVSDQTITSFFLVHEKEIRNSAGGKAYLRMELGDRSGTVESRMWDQFEICAKDVHRDDFVKVQGRVELYRNRFQLILHTPYNVDDLFQQLLGFIAELKNPWLKQLSTAVFSDPQLVVRFKRAPAAKVMHHAYLGGLLEHVVSLCGLAKQIAAHYPELDVDLLLIAALLHDVGKLDELCYERAVGYTTEGQLLGHIIMELDTVTKAMDAMAGFPPKLKTVVQHILISHHGEYEFGSPKLPMIREALVFHYMDDLDSKVAAVRAALAIPSAEDDWSAYSGALGRKFLRLPDFLKEPQAGGK